MTEELRKQLNEESEAFQNIFEQGEIGCGKDIGEKTFRYANMDVERKSLEEAKKNGIELPKVKFTLMGFGRDANGNSLIKLKNSNGKGFSIQTNKGGDFQKIHSMRSNKAKELDAKQLETIAKIVSAYIKEFGTKSMKEDLDECGDMMAAKMGMDEGKGANVVTPIFSDKLLKLTQELLTKSGNRTKVGKVGLGKVKSNKDGVTFKESILFDDNRNIIGHYNINVMIDTGGRGEFLDIALGLQEV